MGQFTNMLSSFLNVNALPGPMLRSFFRVLFANCVHRIVHRCFRPLLESIFGALWSQHGVQRCNFDVMLCCFGDQWGENLF